MEQSGCYLLPPSAERCFEMGMDALLGTNFVLHGLSFNVLNFNAVLISQIQIIECLNPVRSM